MFYFVFICFLHPNASFVSVLSLALCLLLCFFLILQIFYNRQSRLFNKRVKHCIVNKVLKNKIGIILKP